VSTYRANAAPTKVITVRAKPVTQVVFRGIIGGIVFGLGAVCVTAMVWSIVRGPVTLGTYGGSAMALGLTLGGTLLLAGAWQSAVPTLALELESNVLTIRWLTKGREARNMQIAAGDLVDVALVPTIGERGSQDLVLGTKSGDVLLVNGFELDHFRKLRADLAAFLGVVTRRR
jgi:hypothetical protein